MTDRLTEIKARLVQNLRDSCSDYAALRHKSKGRPEEDLACSEEWVRFNELTNQVRWLIAELEKERAENARLLDINHGLQMQLDEHLGEQPKVCADCIKNYHTVCQWEIEYKPGCVCGCHLTRNLLG